MPRRVAGRHEHLVGGNLASRSCGGLSCVGRRERRRALPSRDQPSVGVPMDGDGAVAEQADSPERGEGLQHPLPALGQIAADDGARRVRLLGQLRMLPRRPVREGCEGAGSRGIEDPGADVQPQLGRLGEVVGGSGAGMLAGVEDSDLQELSRGAGPRAPDGFRVTDQQRGELLEGEQGLGAGPDHDQAQGRSGGALSHARQWPAGTRSLRPGRRHRRRGSAGPRHRRRRSRDRALRHRAR